MTATQNLTRTTYNLTGMTCGSCEARVKSALEDVPEVINAQVDKDTASVILQTITPVSIEYLQRALTDRYQISAQQVFNPGIVLEADEKRSWLETYRPLLTVISLIALVAVLAQAPFNSSFDGLLFMRHFMAGFFIVFAGFKLLDITGFSESYAMYDVIAKRWSGWGNIYPFIEMGLGLSYLTNIAPFYTNIATIVILGISAIGVIQSVLDKRTIKCACLGTGFNLPMSTVTIIEDVGMVLMAVAMLIFM